MRKEWPSFLVLQVQSDVDAWFTFQERRRILASGTHEYSYRVAIAHGWAMKFNEPCVWCSIQCEAHARHRGRLIVAGAVSDQAASTRGLCIGRQSLA